MIPAFNDLGDLPIGGHLCTLQEFMGCFVNNERRRVLWEKFQPYMQLARNCGFISVLVGGSFVTTCERPKDIDINWITEENVRKESVHPDCVEIMEDHLTTEDFPFSMGYLPIGRDEDKIQYWAGDNGFGFDSKNARCRGTILLTL